MRSKNKTEAEWMTLIQTCCSSGLTDRSWCEQNGISINTFYNTISKLRKKSCVIPKSLESRVNELPEIVPVSVSSEFIAYVVNAKAASAENKTKKAPKPISRKRKSIQNQHENANLKQASNLRGLY